MKRALIVDDRDENLYLLRLQLQSAGWEIDEARHGGEALVKARAQAPNIVISDLLMPVMDGYTLLRYWRADPQLRSIPFVVFTATYTDPSDEQLALDLGADAFILRPALPEPFLARIGQIVANGMLTRPTHTPSTDTEQTMKEYSAVLVRKLEEKTLQLTEANQELALREQRLQLALSAARMATGDWDIESGNVVWSKGYEQLWGMMPESFQGAYAEFDAALHPDDRQRVNRAVQSAIAERREYNAEFRVVWPDSSVHWIAGRGSATYDNAGQPIRMIGIVMDITERHRAEEQLRESEARLRGILDSMFAYVGLFSTDGILLEVNRAPLAAAGVLREDMVGKSFTNIYWLSHSQTVLEQFGSALRRAAAGETVREDFDVRLAGDAIIPMDITLGPLRDATGNVVQIVASGVDITVRKQTEAARQKLEAQLWQAQKMEALGTLAGGVAHDFNNILSAIVGNTELVRQDLGAAHPATTSLTEISKATQRAKAVVQQILTFSRKQPLEQRVLALEPVIEECAAMLRATLPMTVELHVQCADDAPNVLADATQIQQVLLNLGTNAWHALGGAPGRVDIHLQLAVVDAHLAQQHVGLLPGRYANIAISDTGSGMSEATLARIFEPFFTTKEVGQGTGLGLSVVDGIVKRHGGTITVTSAVAAGSTFAIFLPAVNGQSSAKQAKTPQASPRGHGQRILYIDDDEALVLLATKMLQRQGYQVNGFISATQALDVFRAAPHEFDLAITDFTMPGITGLQVAQQLMSIRNDLPVMLISGYVTDELKERAQRANIRFVLYKPDTVEELCEAVHKMIVGAGSSRSS